MRFLVIQHKGWKLQVNIVCEMPLKRYFLTLDSYHRAQDVTSNKFGVIRYHWYYYLYMALTR